MAKKKLTKARKIKIIATAIFLPIIFGSLIAAAILF